MPDLARDSRWTVRLLDGRCSGCKFCLPACDSGALIWVDFDRELLVDPWACTGCGSCVTLCPDGALRLERGIS